MNKTSLKSGKATSNKSSPCKELRYYFFNERGLLPEHDHRQNDILNVATAWWDSFIHSYFHPKLLCYQTVHGMNFSHLSSLLFIHAILDVCWGTLHGNIFLFCSHMTLTMGFWKLKWAFESWMMAPLSKSLSFGYQQIVVVKSCAFSARNCLTVPLHLTLWTVPCAVK